VVIEDEELIRESILNLLNARVLVQLELEMAALDCSWQRLFLI